VSSGEIVEERQAASSAGLDDGQLEHLLALTRGAAVAGHDVRFDVRFLDARLRRLHGARLAAPLVDTLTLARRLLAGRTERFSLPALAHFFGVPTRPEHRSLPDARATAEVLLELIELARERGARTLADLCALARPASPRSPAVRVPVLRSARGTTLI
jgi:DNA polymerase-3 subunit epsilon